MRSQRLPRRLKLYFCVKTIYTEKIAETDTTRQTIKISGGVQSRAGRFENCILASARIVLLTRASGESLPYYFIYRYPEYRESNADSVSFSILSIVKGIVTFCILFKVREQIRSDNIRIVTRVRIVRR